MKNTRLPRRRALCAAMLLAFAAPAGAVDYNWLSGNFSAQNLPLGIPNPLDLGDVLNINTANNHFFDVNFANHLGEIYWNDGTVFLLGGVQVLNNNIWHMHGDDLLQWHSGAQPAFINGSAGTFRKAGGTGTSTVGTLAFVNDGGLIQADMGTLLFSGNSNTFNSGGTFAGAGIVAVSGNSTFHGNQTTTSLELRGAGEFTGNAAVVHGTLRFTGGSFFGGWEIAPNQTMVASGTDNKFFDAGTFTNRGSLLWQTDATVFMRNGMTIDNQGLFEMQGSALTHHAGDVPTFRNAGELRVAAGQEAQVNAVRFVNDGALVRADAGATLTFQGGNATFNDGTRFEGEGAVRITSNAIFNGAFQSQNLTIAAGVMQGNGAVLSGAASFTGGELAGSWVIANGQQLNAANGGNKFLNGTSLTNLGTIAWNSTNTLWMIGSTLDNQGTFELLQSASLQHHSGGGPVFANNGIFRVAAGASGNFVSGHFVNNGLIESHGVLNFSAGGSADFNNGTTFAGAGAVNLHNQAAYHGNITTTNAVIQSGTHTGVDATVHGNLGFAGGTLAGKWTLANGSTLTATAGGNKFLSSADFTNLGNVAWNTTASLFLIGSTFLNEGSFNALQSMSIDHHSGAGPTFRNKGVLSAAATRTITVTDPVFVNDGGELNAAAGAMINFATSNARFNDGTRFTGAGVNQVSGTARFVGGIASENLRLNGTGTYTGGDGTAGSKAVLSGVVNLAAGLLTGQWELPAAQQLVATGTGNKFFDAGTFTNDGAVAWNTTASMFMRNGGLFDNRGRFDANESMSILHHAGGVPTLRNTGVFNAADGRTATVSSIVFSNEGGELRAGTGANINFSGGTGRFYQGTRFTGPGTVSVTSDALFVGGFDSQNLRLNGTGTYTGGDGSAGSKAVASGNVRLESGLFIGHWEIASGQTMTATTTGNKFFDAGSFTNRGTLDWQANANALLRNGVLFTNAGTLRVTTDGDFVHHAGANPVFLNAGLLVKSGGAGVTTINNGLNFDNEGVVAVGSGTIALPTGFTNDGTLTGTGTFSMGSSTLTNTGHVAPGASPGTLTLTGSYSQTASGFLDIEIASSTLADRFNVSGTATLSGTLALSCVMGCAIDDGDEFIILDSAGNLTGTFANITTTGFGTGFDFDIFYDQANDWVKLAVVDAGVNPIPEPETYALLLAGLGLLGFAARRRIRGRSPN